MTISVVAVFFLIAGVGKEDVKAWTSTTACRKPNSSNNMTEVDAVVFEVFLGIAIVFFLMVSSSLSLFVKGM